MHTLSLVQIIVSGLVATSAVASLEVAGTGALARHVAPIVALAIPALAAPAVKDTGVEAREPKRFVLPRPPAST